MKKLITFLTIALLTFAVPALAWQVFTPPLVVEEVDGAPSLGTTTTLVFPSGSLTVLGGTATYTPVAGAGIGGIDTYVQYNDGGVFGGDAGFVYDDATDTLTIDKVIVTTSFLPAVGNTVDLGTALLQFQDGFFSGTVTAPIFAAGIAGTGSGSYSAHHGGQLTFFDDGNDTSVVFGPVTDGTTILGITGTLDFSGQGDTGFGTAAVAGAQFTLPQEDDAVTPTLAFGDGDTGFFEYADDEIRMAFNGASKWQFEAGFIGVDYQSYPMMYYAQSTATVPNFRPSSDDPDTGIGHHSADNVSLVSGGAEAVRSEDPADLGATETSLWIYSLDDTAVLQVTVGADDSGGVGYKLLRLAN